MVSLFSVHKKNHENNRSANIYRQYKPIFTCSTLYSVHCTLYTVHCTLYTVHCTLYPLRCIVMEYINLNRISSKLSNDSLSPISEQNPILEMDLKSFLPPPCLTSYHSSWMK